MEKKGNYKKRSFKNKPESDSDFDLDAYLEEQSSEDGSLWEGESQPEEDPSYRSKNTMLVVALIIASFLWYFDWSIPNAWNSLFGGDQVTVAEVSPNIEVNIPEINIPDINIPDIPPIPAAPGIGQNFQTPSPDALDMSLTEYLSELKSQGYLADDKLSTFSARQLYDSNIPISYLQQLDEAGYLADLSFVDITNYYSNNIPMSYLDELREAGVYEELSFVDVTNFYQQNIPIEYLQRLDEAGYLDDLSFVYVTNYYQNGITVEFLDQLKESGLYEDLNFLDVIDIYKRENPTEGQ